MVPVYHSLYEGVLLLLCVINRQLEAASISDLVTLDYVCDIKVLILGGSYPSAASIHRGQVGLFCCCCFWLLFFFFLGGEGGMVGM